MIFYGQGALDRCLKIPKLNTSKHVVFRYEDSSIYLMSVAKYIDFVESQRWEAEIHPIMYSGSNLFIDIDTKTQDEYDKAVGLLEKFDKHIKSVEGRHRKIYSISISNSPTSIHYHAHGLWFDDVRDISTYIKTHTTIKIDRAVYKRNTSLRLGLCEKDTKVYSILSTYGLIYTDKNIITLLTPSIPPKRKRTLDYKYIPKKTIMTKVAIDDVREIISSYGIDIESFVMNNSGYYIIPKKPWMCPLCEREHHNNNFIVSIYGEIKCFVYQG